MIDRPAGAPRTPRAVRLEVLDRDTITLSCYDPVLVLATMLRAGRVFSSQESVDERVAALAASQHGVFSRADAIRLGADRGLIQRRLTARRWAALHAGVYRICGAPDTERQRLLAACLACGRPAAASHRAAADVLQLAGFRAGPLEITVPRGRRVRRAGILIHEGSLPRADVALVDAIPVTNATRTLIDLGAVAPLEAVEEALDDALRRRLTSLSRLRWRLSDLGASDRPGISVARSLLEARASGGPPQSVLETRFLRLVTRAGLPAPARQRHIRDGGRLIAIVDFAYPNVRLAIEVEGYRWHSGRASWEHDLARRNELTARGWRVIHITSSDLVRRSNTVVEAIISALGDRSSRSSRS